MTDLHLVGRSLTDKRSRLRQFADAMRQSGTDLDAALAQLPPDLATAIGPHVQEVRMRLGALAEVALIAGYRAGLVDFYEDTPS